jgi:hypothetical protein
MNERGISLNEIHETGVSGISGSTVDDTFHASVGGGIACANSSNK